MDSTFPHQPKAGGPSSLSREGNVLHAFLLQSFWILTFIQNIRKRDFPFFRKVSFSYPCADGRSKSANPPTSNLLPRTYLFSYSQNPPADWLCKSAPLTSYLLPFFYAPTRAVGLPTYEPRLIPTCESSDSHRQQTKFAAFRYVLRPPRIYICKFEPGREAEVVPEDKKVHGLYVYGTFMNPF